MPISKNRLNDVASAASIMPKTRQAYPYSALSTGNIRARMSWALKALYTQ